MARSEFRTSPVSAFLINKQVKPLAQHEIVEELYRTVGIPSHFPLSLVRFLSRQPLSRQENMAVHSNVTNARVSVSLALSPVASCITPYKAGNNVCMLHLHGENKLLSRLLVFFLRKSGICLTL